MNNNDVLKKLRVALQLRDDQIVEILQLADFRMSKAEVGAFFRNENHPNYMECGDQVLRNFLNGLIIHLRGTKENPKNPNEVISENKAAVKTASKAKAPAQNKKPGLRPDHKTSSKNTKNAKPAPIVEKVRFKNGNKNKG